MELIFDKPDNLYGVIHCYLGKGLRHLDLIWTNFSYDIHFFFKHSSALKEDYTSIEEVTTVASQYAMQHTETRWLTIKYVAVM